MQKHHYFMLIAAVILGYFVGVKWPGGGMKVLGAVPSVSP